MAICDVTVLSHMDCKEDVYLELYILSQIAHKKRSEGHIYHAWERPLSNKMNNDRADGHC